MSGWMDGGTGMDGEVLFDGRMGWGRMQRNASPSSCFLAVMLQAGVTCSSCSSNNNSPNPLDP